MSRKIRGIQLVHPPYDLTEAEVLALIIEKGLQPRADDGSLIPCPKRCHQSYALQEWTRFHRMSEENKREVARRLEQIKRDPERRSWKYFGFSPHDPLSKKILNDKVYPLLWNALFLKEDLERLGVLPKMEPSAPSVPEKKAQKQPPNETLDEFVMGTGLQLEQLYERILAKFHVSSLEKEDWRNLTLSSFDETPEQWPRLDRICLSNEAVYDFSRPDRRSFIGKLLRAMASHAGFGVIGYRTLYNQYKAST